MLLLILVYLLPLAFTAVSPNSWWCSIAYFFTSSGGPVGFLVLLLLTALAYASTAPRRRNKILVFFKSITALGLFFAVLAYVNEHGTKHLLKAQRPSHVYMLQRAGLGNNIDSLYGLEKNQRKALFAGPNNYWSYCSFQAKCLALVFCCACRGLVLFACEIV